MHAQFEQAITDGNHEVACFCLRSLIVQAASDYRVGMAGQVSVCGPLRAAQKGQHSPPWFDAVCKEERPAFMKALNTGQPLHARDILKKRYKLQVRWAKRAHTSKQRDVFLGRLASKAPDVHAMLRRS